MRPATKFGPAPILLAVGLILSGCGWLGGDDEVPLPGERISVLELDEAIEISTTIAEAPFSLPAAAPRADWPMVGGGPSHSAGHPTLGSGGEAWRADIGAGASSNRRLVNPPIVAGGRLYAMDAEGRVAAIDIAGGNEIWQVRVASPYEDSNPLGGGLAFGDGVLVATTGFGEVVGLDPGNGGALWARLTDSPIRAAPTVGEGMALAVSVDNTLYAFDVRTGEQLWTHSGILEGAGLLGGAAPAIQNGVVAAAYSSGEIFALRATTGRPIWSDSLNSIRRLGPLESLSDIRGAPVIDNGRVIATSHSGRMVSIDIRSGVRIWEQPVGGIETPSVVGDNVFTITNTNQVVALTRDRGLIRWVTPLPRYKNPEKREDAIVWAGPVLAGNRLWLVGSTERMIGLDPATGEIAVELELPDGARIPPIIAENTLFVLTENATVVAYR